MSAGTMKVVKLDLGEIVVEQRLRAVDPDKVDMIAASIAEIGMQTPITVQPIDGRMHLVAGAHRLAAARKLSWATISAIEVDLNEIDRRRWEIAENLHRSELTVLQRDEHVAEWIRLTEKSEQVSAQVAPKPKSGPQGGRPQAGVRAAARDLHIDRDDARRAVKVASLTDEAKEAAREVGLDDNRSALLEAAKAPNERQAQAVRDIAARKAAVVAGPVIKFGNGRKLPAIEVTKNFIDNIADCVAARRHSEELWKEVIELHGFDQGTAHEYAAILANAIDGLRELQSRLCQIARVSQ